MLQFEKQKLKEKDQYFNSAHPTFFESIRGYSAFFDF